MKYLVYVVTVLFIVSCNAVALIDTNAKSKNKPTKEEMCKDKETDDTLKLLCE